MPGTPAGGKLVRDRIPEIIRASGRSPVTRRLSHEQFATALRDKLLEEAGEACGADGPEDLVDELADVLEVLRALAATVDRSLSDVLLRADSKASERGGFQQRWWLQTSGESAR